MEQIATMIGYPFRNPQLLLQALSHPSLGKEGSNQRMEFLGDAVLGLIISDMLYQLYPEEQEGELARRHAALVRGETLAAIAQELGLGEALRLSGSEAASGGRQSLSNLEDALEALIGALYLDGGLEAAKAFVLPRWERLATQRTAPPKDAKTSLQEWAQGRGFPVPAYHVVQQTGPAHAPQFTVEVSVVGQPAAQASAPSKRAAEQLAAQSLLQIIETP